MKRIVAISLPHETKWLATSPIFKGIFSFTALWVLCIKVGYHGRHLNSCPPFISWTHPMLILYFIWWILNRISAVFLHIHHRCCAEYGPFARRDFYRCLRRSKCCHFWIWEGPEKCFTWNANCCGEFLAPNLGPNSFDVKCSEHAWDHWMSTHETELLETQ